jgi:hypothetical protein
MIPIKRFGESIITQLPKIIREKGLRNFIPLSPTANLPIRPHTYAQLSLSQKEKREKKESAQDPWPSFIKNVLIGFVIASSFDLRSKEKILQDEEFEKAIEVFDNETIESLLTIARAHPKCFSDKQLEKLIEKLDLMLPGLLKEQEAELLSLLEWENAYRSSSLF